MGTNDVMNDISQRFDDPGDEAEDDLSEVNEDEENE